LVRSSSVALCMPWWSGGSVPEEFGHEDAMTPRQTQYLVERLHVRAGIRAQVPAGALVHALRHRFASSALEAEGLFPSCAPSAVWRA
jgi:hypothetical protein